MTQKQIEDLKSVWFDLHRQIHVIEKISKAEIAEGDKTHEDDYPIDHCHFGFGLETIAKNITRYTEKLEELIIYAEKINSKTINHETIHTDIPR